MRRIRWRSLSLLVVFFAVVCSTGVALGAQGNEIATWPIVYQDDFEDPESGWEVGETKYVNRAYVGGAYEMQVKGKWLIVWNQIPGNPELRDFSVETDIQVAEGAGQFGLLFRYVDSDNFYKLTVSTDGHYQLVLQEEGAYYALLDGQVAARGKSKTSARRAGSSRLKIVATGDEFSLFLDGDFLGVVRDSSFTRGQVALCAETFDARTLVVRFSHLKLRAPPEQLCLEDYARLLYLQGWGLYKSDGYEAALAPLSQACHLFESLGWTKEIGQSAYVLADSLYGLARYHEAVLQFQRATDAFLAIHSPQMAALSLSSHGNCLIELGDYEKALHSFQQAYSLYQDADDTWGKATTLIYSSMAYAGLGDYHAAIRAGQGAIDLYEMLNEKPQVALTSNTLAIYCMLLGDYALAQSYSSEALALYNDFDDSPGMALACTILGHVHLAAGTINLAAEDFKQALSISSSAANFPLDLRAIILEGLATCLLEQEEPELARQCLEVAQSIQERLGDPRGNAALLSSLGDYWYRFSDYPKAIQYYEGALAITAKIGEKVEQAMNLANLGNCYSKLGDQQKAIDYYKQGIQIMEDTANTDYYAAKSSEVLWRLYWDLGLSQYEFGKANEGVEEWVKAVDVIEKMRGQLSSAEMTSLFMWDKFSVYWHLVNTLFEMGNADMALSYAERAKARTLVDMMETTMLQRMDAIDNRLHPMAEILNELRGLDDVSIASFSELMADQSIQAGRGAAVEQSQKDYITIRKSLEREYPALGDTLAVEPAMLLNQVQAVQQHFGEGTVTLEYFVTDAETIVWVITNDGIQTASRITITRDELTEQVRGFREEIESPPVLGQEAVSYLTALEKGRDFYQILITPVENYLQGATHLVIVPSDVLFYLPFEALVSCRGCEGRDLYGGKFLIEDYSMSYAPSMASLYWPFQHASEGSYDSILAVGNPTGDLTASEEEVLAAAALFPQPTVLIGEQASEAAVKGALQIASYDVVHLSTHGLFDTTMPLLSELVFRKGGKDDGNLYAGEILGLPLETNLVVLSACQTALPPELTEEAEGLVVGDELQGLSQAMFVAGVPSAVLTLWNVNDESTSQLMQAMYKGLQGGAKKGEALRQAQLFLIHDASNLTYHHPYYWAPFVLYGDWR